MKVFFFVCLSIFTQAMANSHLPGELSIELFSRNMPRSCELVFEVESDIKISLSKEIQDQLIVYQFQNSWAPFNWGQEKKASLQEMGAEKNLELTLLSMSIPAKYLYRHIKIHLPKSNITCIAEFGREFGEVCRPEGRSTTPWKQRSVECEISE